VLIYGHYDVQPADKKDGWDTEPFEPVIKGDDLYGRGSTDNKGQIFAHMKAIETCLQEAGTLPVNVKFLIEGEEEIGGSNTHEFVKSHHEKLKCDVVAVSDTPMYEKGVPTIVYSLRGICNFGVDVYGPKNDVHSGLFGGSIANPAIALAQMIAALHDENGRITVPGFYDDVRAMNDNESSIIRSLAFNEEAYRQSLNVEELVGEKGYNSLERTWSRPSLDITGFSSGYTGDGYKNIVPSKAHANISIRLVPNQRPEKIYQLCRTYLEKIAPKGITLKISDKPDYGNPFITSLDVPAMGAAMRAFKKAFEKDAIINGSGGTIPIFTAFQQELHAPVVAMGLGMPGENMHGPNERFSLTHFEKGILASIYFLEEMSKLESAAKKS
jgi:acetylornithine deacetylase/succinyl-diaminopimelate desuccinylase-like protein